jgi:hypothetical protein
MTRDVLSPEALEAAGWKLDDHFPNAETDATIEVWSRGRNWQEIRVEPDGERRIWDRGEWEDIAGGGGSGADD